MLAGGMEQGMSGGVLSCFAKSGTFRVHCGDWFRSFDWIDGVVVDPSVDIDLSVSDESADGHVRQFAAFAAPAGERRDGDVELLGGLPGGEQAISGVGVVVLDVVLLCGARLGA